MPESRKFTTNTNTSRVEEFDDLLKGIDKNTNFYWSMTYPMRPSVSDTPSSNNETLETVNQAVGKTKSMSGYGPAPALQPINRRSTGTGDKLTTNTKTPSVHVNVRDNHHWTESPISSRREVPMLNLKEQRIMTNVALNQMFNMGAAAAEAAADTTQKLQKVMEAIGENSDFDQAAKNLKNLTSSDPTANPLLGQSTTYADPMNPYALLYTTIPTGFKYILPYMQNTYVNNMGGFGESADGGVLMNSFTKLAEMGKEFLQTINLNKSLSPGRMVETPKAFTFTGREKSYTVSFPLFNTRDYAEVVKNWQFIYLLSYQNTPNRVSRDLIDPPCIYEAYIPGIWYSKFCALTNMEVEFIGARREMYIPIHTIDHAENGNTATGSGNWQFYNKKAVAVIPDAYQVKLTFTELFSETQNFKYQMLRESMNDIISTGELM